MDDLYLEFVNDVMAIAPETFLKLHRPVGVWTVHLESGDQTYPYSLN